MSTLYLSPLYEKSDLVSDDEDLTINFHSSEKNNYQVSFSKKATNSYAKISVVLDRDDRKYIFVDIIFNNTNMVEKDFKDYLKEINEKFFRVFP